jgi:hypothetical protein
MTVRDPFHHLLSPSQRARLGHLIVFVLLALAAYLVLTNTAAGL